MTKIELNAKILVITAQLQILVELLEEVEGYNTPFANGHIKKRCVFLKQEIDNYLNRVFSVDEEGQIQMFTIINALENNYRNLQNEVFKQIEIQM